MSINLGIPQDEIPDLKPRITVVGVGGAGGNAVNNMIESSLEGVEFVVANTDAQALSHSKAERRIQLGATATRGLGAGARAEIGQEAAEEAMEEVMQAIHGTNMAFIAAGMGGGTGTGAAPVIARAAKEAGILTVGVVTKPFQFEGTHRMRIAEAGIKELEKHVDTLIIIPNQNLFRVATEKTTFADAFKMADDVLYSGVRGVTDLMVMPGLINLDFADVRTVMNEMGRAMMGTGEAEGERRALDAAEAAISNPLLDDTSMKGAKGVLINITGGPDMTLFEVDEAANRIRAEVDQEAYIIFGSTFDEQLQGRMRVSVVATGLDSSAAIEPRPAIFDLAPKRVVSQPVETPTSAPIQMAEPAVAAAVAPVALETEPEPEPEPEFEPAAVTEAAAAVASAALKVAEEEPAPAVAQAEAFIPRRPAAPESEAMGSVDPFAEADMLNPPRDIKKPGVKGIGLSIFERVTGASRSGEGAAEAAKQEKPLQIKPQAAPSRLHGLTSADRPAPASQPDEATLEIPSFLRRQAN